MTGLAVETAVSSGAARLEVRWIRRGVLDVGTLDWFGRFPAASESRQDDYLVRPDLDGLSVKLRGGRALEVKVYRGSLGVLDLPDRARGVQESWQRWSFPLGSVSRGSAGTASWRSVHKTRRMTFFSMNEGRLSASVPGSEQEAGCAVELTDVKMGGHSWWTLGFEATGPADELQSVLAATAALVFDRTVAAGPHLTTDDSGSYFSWLREQLRAEQRVPRTTGA
jgi:hypothetical protein